MWGGGSDLNIETYGFVVCRRPVPTLSSFFKLFFLSYI